MVSGDCDRIQGLQQKHKIDINGVKIGLIHGHQVIPWDELESLRNVEREIDCDILLTGHTHKQYLRKLTATNYVINPGSATGAFSALDP